MSLTEKKDKGSTIPWNMDLPRDLRMLTKNPFAIDARIKNRKLSTLTNIEE